MIDVGVESTASRAFASALDWPGWCRPGRTEAAALEALLEYAPRYAPIAGRAGLRLAPGGHDLRVVERLPGDATTTFGAPAMVATVEREPPDAATADRLARLLEAAWSMLDDVAATAPAELRKGPRGGGRDRDAVVDHVLAAEASYARRIGVKRAAPTHADRAGVASLRVAVIDAIRRRAGPDPAPGRAWPLRYAVRRCAWHVVDHGWEIEDRGRPVPRPDT